MKRKLIAATLVLVVPPLLAAAAGAEEEEAASLYDRLGGLRTIAPVIDDFVDHLYGNPVLGKNPGLAASQREAPPSYLKFQFSQLVCEMSGGPCVYSGKTMKEAHESLKIGDAEWEAMADELKKSLAKFNVAPAEQTELLELFGQTKDDIMDDMEVAKSK